MQAHLFMLLGLCGGLAAQVPYGDAILSNFTNSAPMEGLLLVKRNGTATPVTGLAATSRGSNDINSIQLDPVDNRVWIGGITASAGRVDTLTVSGSTVANFAAVTNVGTAASVSGIAFDANGNAIASSGAINGTGGLFRIDRKTSAVTRIVGGPTWTGLAGTCNCVCSDAAGNLYFGVTGAAIYSLAPGANGDYSGAVGTVGTVFPPRLSATLSSVEVAPAVGARPARAWWTTFGSAGTAVGYIPLPSGTAVVQGPVGGNNAPNWLDYDALNDDFWLISGGIDPDTIYTMDHAGNPTQVALVPPNGVNGSPSAIDANDCAAGAVTIIPQYLPASGTIDVEVATCCPPGQVGGVFIPSVGILIVAARPGADGRIYIKIPNLTIVRGTPNAVTLQGVCYDPTTGRITFGSAVTWPKN